MADSALVMLHHFIKLFYRLADCCYIETGPSRDVHDPRQPTVLEAVGVSGYIQSYLFFGTASIVSVEVGIAPGVVA